MRPLATNKRKEKFRATFSVKGVRIPLPSKVVRSAGIRFREARPDQHKVVYRIGEEHEELKASVIVAASDITKASQIARNNLESFLQVYSIVAARDAEIVAEEGCEQITGNPRHVIHMPSLQFKGTVVADEATLAKWKNEHRRTAIELKKFRMSKERFVFEIARQHYSYALSSPRLETRFVECIAGLEALFSNSADSLTYKIAMRAAVFLDGSKRPKEAYEMYNLIKEMYNERSNLLHGRGWKNRPYVEKNLPHLIEYLRQSLLRFLDVGQSLKKGKLLEKLDESIVRRRVFSFRCKPEFIDNIVRSYRAIYASD